MASPYGKKRAQSIYVPLPLAKVSEVCSGVTMNLFDDSRTGAQETHKQKDPLQPECGTPVFVSP